MTKKPYITAIGMSLLIHSVVLAILVVLGSRIDSVSYATPIEVEVIPASVLDAEQIMTDYKPPALDSRAVTSQLAAAAASHSLQKQALSKEDLFSQDTLQDMQVRDMTVVQGTANRGTTSGIVSSVSANSGNRDAEKKNERQQSKPIVRTQASHLSGVRPTYPYEARQAGLEGTVVVRILVGTDGSPISASVRASSGHGILDEAATQAVKKWRFSPARQGDNVIESYYDVRVKFDLADE